MTGEGVTARFGTVDALLDGTGFADEPYPFDPIGLPARAPAKPAERTPAKRATTRPSKPAAAPSAGSYIYAGVGQDVRTVAPLLALKMRRTLADLVLLGTQLELPYGIAGADDHGSLPVGKVRAAAVQLGNMQIRVSAAQRAWLENASEQIGAVSLRQFAGAALTAFVDAHRAELDGAAQ